MEERRQEYPRMIKDIEDIKKDVEDVKHLLNGNGKIGMAAKVELHEQYINDQKARNSDLFTTAYRALIGLAIAYIAYKVGFSTP